MTKHKWIRNQPVNLNMLASTSVKEVGGVPVARVGGRSGVAVGQGGGRGGTSRWGSGVAEG